MEKQLTFIATARKAVAGEAAISAASAAAMASFTPSPAGTMPTVAPRVGATA